MNTSRTLPFGMMPREFCWIKFILDACKTTHPGITASQVIGLCGMIQPYFSEDLINFIREMVVDGETADCSEIVPSDIMVSAVRDVHEEWLPYEYL